MPQKKEYGKWTDDFNDLKSYLSILDKAYYGQLKYKERDIATEIGLGGVNLDYSQWTKNDIVALRFTAGKAQAQGFILMALAANEKDAAGQYTPEALDAQAALEHLMPRKRNGAKRADLQRWEDFSDMISDANEIITDRFRKILEQQKKDRLEKSKQQPAGKKTGFLFEAPSGVMPSLMDDKSFDQQAALATLDAHGVTMDAKHDLKKPLETQITEAIKGIAKGSIRVA